MKRIYKYELEVTDRQTLKLPKDSDLLCIQSQMDKPCLWAIVDVTQENYETEDVEIITHGTGHETNPRIGQYLGTYQLRSGTLVFHCFKGIPI